MSLDRILCLANSYKHENRCVAGVSLITKKWLRLIGRQVPGCLTANEACYSDGKQVAVLDVFETELGEECGSNCHPEDVFITAEPINLIRHIGVRDAGFLDDYVNKGPALLQGYGDRLYARVFESVRAHKSLELIQPEDLWWWIREENGKRKNRALFRAGHVSRTRYDLAVTDPVWLDQLNLMPAGIYPHSLFYAGKPPKTLLTVSLSEPFENFHYKLVAGVVILPS